MLTNAQLRSMTVEQLIELNRTVVQEIKLRQMQKAQDNMRNFRVNDMVEFEASGNRGLVRGKIVRMGGKTVKVLETHRNGRPSTPVNWSVHGSFLKHADS